MKTVLLITCALFGLSHQLNFDKILKDFEDTIDAQARDCYGEFSSNRASLDAQLKLPELPDDKNFKCFFDCVLSHLNFFDKSGALVEASLKKYVDKDADKIYTACKDVSEPDGCDKFLGIAKCIQVIALIVLNTLDKTSCKKFFSSDNLKVETLFYFESLELLITIDTITSRISGISFFFKKYCNTKKNNNKTKNNIVMVTRKKVHTQKQIIMSQETKPLGENFDKILKDFEDTVDAQARDCYGEFNYNRATLDSQLKLPELPDDKNFKCFFDCVLTHLNFFDKSGALVEATLKKYVAKDSDKIYAACKDISEPDGCDKFLGIAKCINSQVKELAT
ncbi:hypothetical protein RN001_001919 [Aquatica leii]|uniref:Uncharacterized protein n=1 Tax=Aquatica leii TaxID=1421715 RepID=A0AAN7QN57_9COLE|nr:hypothetical protein RN001_001919 [Aquatica leii]